MQKRIIALAITALATTYVYAEGQSSQSGAASPGATDTTSISFEDLDVNKDGFVSKDEAKVMSDLADNMDQYDQNQDQQLDSSEFAQFEEQKLQGAQPGTEQPSTGQPGGSEQPGSGGQQEQSPSGTM